MYESGALKEIVRQLRLAKGDDSFLADVGTDTIDQFKSDFALGQWNWQAEEEFVDLFGCGEGYPFDFTLYQCELLRKEFNVHVSTLTGHLGG